MDLKFWRRHVHEIRAANGDEITDGWDERVNWDALTEALSEISWGAIRLEAIHPETQKPQLHLGAQKPQRHLAGLHQRLDLQNYS